MKEENPEEIYGDIIQLPHHQSKTRKHMSLHDRAAQFAPFAALSGYDDMVKEESRLTDRRTSLSDWEMEVLNQKLELISDALQEGKHPLISFTFFQRDKRKEGGSYVTLRGLVKTLDLTGGKVILFGSEDPDDRRSKPVEIPLKDVTDIQGELVEPLNEI